MSKLTKEIKTFLGIKDVSKAGERWKEIQNKYDIVEVYECLNKSHVLKSRLEDIFPETRDTILAIQVACMENDLTLRKEKKPLDLSSLKKTYCCEEAKAQDLSKLHIKKYGNKAFLLCNECIWQYANKKQCSIKHAAKVLVERAEKNLRGKIIIK